MSKINHIKNQLFSKLPGFIRRKIVRAKLPALSLDIENTMFRPAVSLDDYIKCFRLLHDVYVRSGYIDPSESALRIIPQHSNPASKIFLGCHLNDDSQRIPVYTISLFPDSDEGLPMDDGFKSQLDTLRNQKRKIAEVGCLASNPSFRRRDMNIPMLGNRIMHQYATQYLDLDDLVITVHPKHQWVYEDVLLFEKIGEMSEYSYVKDNPAVAMRLDLRCAEKNYKKVYGACPLEKDLHHFFFSGSSSSIDLSSEVVGRGCNLMETLSQYYASFYLKTGG
ncbi:MAG: N-acyl-L-homoserine lactone synthetase [Desulfobacula sp.]|nr:N-acyl-L-homoserine lactone synthetase [Desulfobacula sp.]